LVDSEGGEWGQEYGTGRLAYEVDTRQGCRKRNIGEMGEWKKKWKRKIKRESVKKQDNRKKQQHFEHFHWHNLMWVRTYTEFIYESCHSESMKSVTKITHVSKLSMIILFLALCLSTNDFYSKRWVWWYYCYSYVSHSDRSTLIPFQA